jgi:hypothetical protein
VAALAVAAQAVLQLTAVMEDRVAALAAAVPPVIVQTPVLEYNQTYQECLELLVTEIEVEIIHSFLLTQVQVVVAPVVLV